MERKNIPKCFVIMPFTVRDSNLLKYSNDKNHWNEVYSGIIVPAIKKAGLRYERDDDDVASRLITENIWRKIEEADVILCDLSALNPNVHLELGWVLRADKKFVLIKDNMTHFNFDLNQYYTYEYSHLLQPSAVANAIQELSEMIKATLSDNEHRYSVVNKLSLTKQANKAVSEGNLEVSLLKELLSEVRTGRSMPVNRMPQQKRMVFPKIETADDLIKMLKGSTWRKKNDLEHIIFQSESVFYNNLAGHPTWRENKYFLGEALNEMIVEWSDGSRFSCLFQNEFTEFVELANQEECVWYLISQDPFRPPWGV